ncbi:MAG: hypothetical protein RIS88_2245 [Pseudomonadota bacterium]|jgi:uncharacterized protein (TIGR00255 family)
MTGYASAQSGGAVPESGLALARLGVEIRSVNSRFLDLSFRLAEDLRQHEPALRELLQSRLKRGKVEVRAGLEAVGAAVLRAPDAHLLQRLHTFQDQVRRVLPDARPLGVADVLRLAAASESGVADAGAHLMPLAEQAVQALLSARAREGARLADMLRGHLGQLRALALQARPLVPQLVEQQRMRFLERWQEAMGLGAQAGASAAPEAAQDRALAEATAFAIRIDVAEELTRLTAHLDEIERLLARGGEAGKRLDFLIQELHREANTLGSKSAALELTRISVDMKVLIEQMREQVQNIE